MEDPIKVPHYIIIEFTKPVTEGLLSTLVQDTNDFYTHATNPDLINTVKEAHRATFDGFGHHVTVEPTIKNEDLS